MSFFSRGWRRDRVRKGAAKFTSGEWEARAHIPEAFNFLREEEEAIYWVSTGEGLGLGSEVTSLNFSSKAEDAVKKCVNPRTKPSVAARRWATNRQTAGWKLLRSPEAAPSGPGPGRTGLESLPQRPSGQPQVLNRTLGEGVCSQALCQQQVRLTRLSLSVKSFPSVTGWGTYVVTAPDTDPEEMEGSNPGKTALVFLLMSQTLPRRECRQARVPLCVPLTTMWSKAQLAFCLKTHDNFGGQIHSSSSLIFQLN